MILCLIRKIKYNQTLSWHLTYARNSLTRLPEWKSLPNMIVNGLAEKVDNTFFATGAVDRPNVLLGEHGTLLLWLLILLGDQHIVQAFDLFTA